MDTYTEYYWSDGEISSEPTRTVKNFYSKNIEKVKATVVAQTVIKKIDDVNHIFNYALVDSGELYDPNQISPRYNKKPWKMISVKSIVLQLYLRFLGFQTKEEIEEEEKFNKGQLEYKPIKKSKGSLALKRKAERYL